jgi:hypothetical protein
VLSPFRRGFAFAVELPPPAFNGYAKRAFCRALRGWLMKLERVFSAFFSSSFFFRFLVDRYCLQLELKNVVEISETSRGDTGATATASTATAACSSITLPSETPYKTEKKNQKL